MPSTLGGQLDGFAAALPERPASFAARGLAMPFTAPLLAGARLRRRGAAAPELLLPALGGRGVYVLGWPSVLQRCAPTLHDRQLWDRVEELPRPGPATLRRAAREVAALGHAGRPAQAAALAAQREAEAAHRAVRAALARRLGPAAPAAAAAAGVELLSLLLAGAGADAAAPGPLARQLPVMEAFAADLARWAAGAPLLEERRAAALVVGAARLTIGAVGSALADLWAAVADPAALLARGEAALQPVAELAERPDWLLDGWPTLCALWAASPPARRGDALAEIVALLPVPPVEADGWPGPAVDWSVVVRARRLVQSRPAWAGGGLVELAARNEALRTLAA